MATRKDALAQAEKSIQDMKGKWTSNALFARVFRTRPGQSVFHTDGDEHGACHAAIHRGTAVTRSAVRIVTAINRKSGYGDTKATPKYAKMWLDYLANRSPIAHVCLTKDIDERWDKHSLVMRTDVPANKLMFFLISTRMTWEYGAKVDAFGKLVEMGADEDVAFFLTSCLVLRSNGEFALQGGGGGAHTSLCGRKIGIDSIRRAKKGLFGVVHGRYDKGGETCGVHVLFERKSATSLSEYLPTQVVWAKRRAAGVKEETTKPAVVNPFAKAKAPVRAEHEGGQYLSAAEGLALAKIVEEAL